MFTYEQSTAQTVAILKYTFQALEYLEGIVSTESAVVSSRARSGLPSELLYADDLVFMAPTMEQLGGRVAEWRASLLDKGLKVNAGKSIVMVGRSGGKMIVNSGKGPCDMGVKGVQANSVQCTVLSVT